MNITDILKATGGSLICGNARTDIDASKVSTDSRTIADGGLFIALKGPNFNGEDFVNDAFKKGATGALVSSSAPCYKKYGKTIIRVRDTIKALQDIAHFHRMRFRIPVVAVTGSNGKTTVKEMTSAVLARRYKVLKNEGTKNNHIGVPQTILKLKTDHDMCILEFGTSHKGEIKTLGNIARPTVCVITNIGPSHLEFLGSLKDVYAEKKEILRTFLYKKGALAIINSDDPYLSRIRGDGLEIVRFGINKLCDFKANVCYAGKRGITFVVNEDEKFRLRLLGVHNVYNALAAIAVARHFGVDYKTIQKALLDYRPACMRLDLKKINGIDIINDTYNSNPISMKCALEVIQYYPARAKWIVSGDMLELGKDSIGFHKKVGELVARSGVQGLLAFGELSKHTLNQAMKSGMKKEMLWYCSNPAEIADRLRKIVHRGDVVLLKASRAMQLEKVLDIL